MSSEMIGKRIASLRREREVKQEELAKYVGVTAQAVSKWENGGVPDTELLPAIADFFGVSIDSLFGRELTDYGDLRTALCRNLIDTPVVDRFRLMFNYCWDMERALFGKMPEDGTVEDYENMTDGEEQMYSSYMSDDGFTRMGIAGRLQYFLLVPDIREPEAAFFRGIDYVSFFRDFSDPDVFEVCIMLNKRESRKAFTRQLLVKSMGMEEEKAGWVMEVLEKYQLLKQTQIEMDDEIQTVYHFYPTPSFIAFLIFAREMIEAPNHFHYYNGRRSKPYLK